MVIMGLLYIKLHPGIRLGPPLRHLRDGCEGGHFLPTVSRSLRGSLRLGLAKLPPKTFDRVTIAHVRMNPDAMLAVRGRERKPLRFVHPDRVLCVELLELDAVR